MFRLSQDIVVRCALGFLALLPAACGGSQQTLPTSPAIAPDQTGSTASSTKVTVVIKLPARGVKSSSSRRRPLFVSPSIASVTVSVSATGVPTVSVTSNVVCTTAIPPVCTVTATVLAPVQKQDTFTVTAYDGPNATGNVLSRGSTVIPVPAGAAIAIPVVLQGVVASIVAVSVANGNPPTGSAATSSVSVSAADADGNVIVGQYETPVNLQLFENDSEGLLSFQKGGAIKNTATVASSTVPAALYLKAKTDTSTPNDASIVASLANAPFVPGNVDPPLRTVGEITTTCAATSPICVFYPSGTAQIVTDAVNNGAAESSSVDNWDVPYVFSGTPQDPVARARSGA